MHLLSCPQCQASLVVSPSQAGDSVPCPTCQTQVAVPKLGELRKLPPAEVASAEAAGVGQRGAEGSRLVKVGFGFAGLLATASLLVAAFCGIRWALIEVPSTTEQHVSEARQYLSERTAAELVREFEDMEARNIDLGLPFRYKEIANRRANWGKAAAISGGVALLALVSALGLAVAGPRKPV